MTACSSKLQHLSYVTEAAWAEASTSATGAVTIPITAMIDASQLGRKMIDPGRVTQFRNERPKMIPGTFDGVEFAMEFECVGHGSATSGTPTITAYESLLAWMIGTSASIVAGTTIDDSTATVSSLPVALTSGYGSGYLVRVGEKGDKGGDGQWAVTSSHATGTLALKTALPDAPTDSPPDVIHSSVVVHTPESDCSVTSRRFFLKTADQSWILHGCFPKSLKVTGGIGQIMKWQATIGVSWVEPVNATFPDTSTTAPWTYNAAPVAGGSVFLQAHGTATRQIVTARQVAVDITLGIQPVTGFDAVSTSQVVVGAKRVPDTIRLSLLVDAAGASASPTWWGAWATNARYHALLGYVVGAGAAVACYLPNLAWSGPQPTQSDLDGLNRVALEFEAGADTAESTDLGRSAMRWGFA